MLDRTARRKPMIDMTYDPEADAAYIYLGRGTIYRQEEPGPFIHDVDVEGRIIGIEILSASKVLAPGCRCTRTMLPSMTGSRLSMI
jgi:uncharacterized protein YuzE